MVEIFLVFVLSFNVLSNLHSKLTGLSLTDGGFTSLDFLFFNFAATNSSSLG